MREIPELYVLCLRAVGSHSCSTEITFRPHDATPSIASRLLRSFHERGTQGDSDAPTMQHIALPPRPCIGPGSSRRFNGNEVDLNHPIIGCRQPTTDPHHILRFQPLIMQYGNPALDVLQSYIDTLVDLGRMDDTRLGPHFFNEWKTNVELAATMGISQTAGASSSATTVSLTPPSKKRRRNGGRSTSASPAPSGPMASTDAADDIPMGSISFHNCSFADETVAAMVNSGMCLYIAVLDLTGIRGLTDSLASRILHASPNLQRLSLKNCRKLTGKSARTLECLPNLQFLDVGGCFNMTTSDIVGVIPALPLLDELHASGLLWDDMSVPKLIQVRDTWKALSLGFSHGVTQPILRESLVQLGESLVSLALPFCETVVDNALLGLLGRNMPLLQYLDLRGNPSLSTITGFYDGRASAYLPVQALTIMARYAGLTENSIEETRRVHPIQTAGDLLTVHLDEKGMGAGILRTIPPLDATAS